MIYRFVRLMTTPFEQWDAYKSGVIDANGKVIVSKNDRTRTQKDSFKSFEVLVRNIKNMLAKIPGGRSTLGSFAAALYLLKEHNLFLDGKGVLNESEISQLDIDAMGKYVTEMVTSANTIDSTGFMSVSQQRKWTKKNAESISKEFL